MLAAAAAAEEEVRHQVADAAAACSFIGARFFLAALGVKCAEAGLLGFGCLREEREREEVLFREEVGRSPRINNIDSCGREFQFGYCDFPLRNYHPINHLSPHHRQARRRG